ncbi:uncharacterized protein LOC132750784 [Ruditapes philippinarum]|uniref:uncharacterized protein LOC132750784 n=1 Tax=Ruditapes philippinarum TaxID=129788 RepID=UPI00295A8BE8|nr:uncharacterized protein LOC132750784 [Ruditapes philippinarum]
MDYIPLTERGDELQRDEEQTEPKLHFIGKSYVCHKGGFKHEHLSKADYFSCNGEDMKTKQKEEHEKNLKDKDLQIAAEKTKEEETRAKAERDLEEQRRKEEQDEREKELQDRREQCER